MDMTIPFIVAGGLNLFFLAMGASLLRKPELRIAALGLIALGVFGELGLGVMAAFYFFR
ncbi:MAG: hypothetical protein QGG36_02855 [Pirellulaceae bacterium]|jgi:hypothetical protein|nr:hypothetical protein [Pirellulaceae bacterium]